MAITFTEENYLKVIFLLSKEKKSRISNLAIGKQLNNNPAAVTEMLKKLHEKKLIDYNRSEGAKLTTIGELEALRVIRKHRLWETFLFQVLDFGWDEVHEIAEQLEHIQSENLIEKIDKLLNHPTFNPLGEQIPDTELKLPELKAVLLSDVVINQKYKLFGVISHNSALLRFLDNIPFKINDTIEVVEIQEFDKSMKILINDNKQTIFSLEVCNNLLVV